VQVEHNAVGAANAQAREKCCAAAKRRDLELRRSQQALQRLADGRFVVNHSDESPRLCHGQNRNENVREAI
jgi:hypothetical protein